jgi:hypothetical protein
MGSALRSGIVRAVCVLGLSFDGTPAFGQFSGGWEITNSLETRGFGLYLVQRNSGLCGIWFENDYGVLSGGMVAGTLTGDRAQIGRCWSRGQPDGTACPKLSAREESLTRRGPVLTWVTSLRVREARALDLRRRSYQPTLEDLLTDYPELSDFIRECFRNF